MPLLLLILREYSFIEWTGFWLGDSLEGSLKGECQWFIHEDL